MFVAEKRAMSRFGFALSAVTLTLSAGVAWAVDYVVERYDKDRIFAGTTAFIETFDEARPRIVEIDMAGRVVWQYAIPADISGGARHAGLGADIEWLPATDRFLVTIPHRGVFEIGRDRKIAWRYETRMISHDADRLASGNTIFVHGQGDRPSEPQVTEVDPQGKLVWQWFARDHLRDESGKRTRRGGFTHANSVIRLASGNTLVSLRNFHKVVEVTPAGEVVWSVGPLANGKPLRHPHDPEVLPNGNLLVSMHGPQILFELGRDGNVVRRFRDRSVKLLRNNHRLPNGNFLLVDVDALIEVTPDFEIVWLVRKPGIRWQARHMDRRELEQSGEADPRLNGFYKAVRVPARQ